MVGSHVQLHSSIFSDTKLILTDLEPVPVWGQEYVRLLFNLLHAETNVEHPPL